MVCRRCKKELPPGSEETCPFCGIRQTTYITPRPLPQKPARTKMPRGTKLSLLSGLLLIVVIAFVIPGLRELNKQSLLEEVEAAYTNGDRQLLSIKVSKLKSSYPSDLESISRAEAMLDTLLGLDGTDGLTEEEIAMAEELRREENEKLIGTVKDTVLDIWNQKISEVNAKGFSSYTFTWENRSNKDVSQLRLSIQGYDKNGDLINGYGGDEAKINLRSSEAVKPGAARERAFLNLWKDTAVVRVEMLSLTVVYSDDTSITLNSEVLDALFG